MRGPHSARILRRIMNSPWCTGWPTHQERGCHHRGRRGRGSQIEEIVLELLRWRRQRTWQSGNRNDRTPGSRSGCGIALLPLWLSPFDGDLFALDEEFVESLFCGDFCGAATGVLDECAALFLHKADLSDFAVLVELISVMKISQIIKIHASNGNVWSQYRSNLIDFKIKFCYFAPIFNYISLPNFSAFQQIYLNTQYFLNILAFSDVYT